METYRDIRPSDFDALFTLASDWAVVRQLGGWKWPPDPLQIRARSKPYDGHDGFVWAICRDDCLIGTIGVTNKSVGYALTPAYHGQGVMTRAVAQALRRAFASDECRFLDATTWHDNAASDAVLRKIGFVQWQTRYEHALARGVPTLSRHYRLSRAAWLERSRQQA